MPNSDDFAEIVPSYTYLVSSGFVWRFQRNGIVVIIYVHTARLINTHKITFTNVKAIVP